MYRTKLTEEFEKGLRPAELFLAKYTSSNDWEQLAKLNWTTYEVMEVMTKFSAEKQVEEKLKEKTK